MTDLRDATSKPPPLTPAATGARLAAIGAALAVAVTGFGYVAGWFSPRLTQARMVTALDAANGVHPGFRRNHAKGMCFSGVFASSGAAVPWSKAALFAAGRVPVTGRFALAGGMPFQDDARGTVRSMAVRFLPTTGAEWRTGMNDIPVFPVNTARGFYEQLLAAKPDPGTGKPDPAAMAGFLERHPESARAIALIKARTVSVGFADSAFNGLDAFYLVNAAGGKVAVRWGVVPLQEAVLQASSPDDDAAPASRRNALFDDLIAQVHEHPLRWRLLLTLGEAGDATADATVAWPAERRQIEAGVISIDEVSSEDAGSCRDINFDPLVVPPGIEPSDDPLLSARSSVYARSFLLRAGEAAVKPPSAVTVAETSPGAR